MEQIQHNTSTLEGGHSSTMGGTKAAPGINFDDLFYTNTLGTTSAVFVAHSGARTMNSVPRPAASPSSNNGKTSSNFHF